MSDEPKIPRDDPRRVTGRYGGQEKQTVELPAAPAWAVSMQESINSQFASVNAHLDTQDHAFDGLQDRVARLEDRESKSRTGPQRTYSGPIRALDEKTSQNDLKHESLIAQLLTTQAATDAKVDALTTTQTTQTEKLTKLDATVVATDKRKMEILEDVHKRATAFIDSPTGRLLKGIVYLAIATYATARGIHIGN